MAPLRYDAVGRVHRGRCPHRRPLAVVHGANVLGTAQVLAIAAELGLSETAFPLPALSG